ncbi:MAG: hypothetical protein ACI87E_001953 [Mariniblastus sp.]|jgi:hypothetical protein
MKPGISSARIVRSKPGQAFRCTQLCSLVCATIVIGTSGCSSDQAPSNGADLNTPVESSEAAAIERVIQAASIVADPESKPRPLNKPSATAKAPVAPEPDVNNPDFHAGLQAAAAAYLKYPMVNQVPAVGNVFCRAPLPIEPTPKLSQSKGASSSHGKKLYFLFAQDIMRYLSDEETEAPEGQVLVKESWTSKSSNPGARNLRNHASGIRINPRTKIGNDVLEIGKRDDLFVMMKLKSDTPDTDQGWVYGVVASDTNKVKAAGRVASCVACHESAQRDRQFGLTLNE